MAKRVLALILIICCLLTACPALADNARRGSVVVNKLGSERRVMVFVTGKMFSFPQRIWLSFQTISSRSKTTR